MKSNFLNNIRIKLVKKLLRPNDGYTYTGFSEGAPLKFYYQEDTGNYLLGLRTDTMYYFQPTLTSWSSYSSRYLPWGETVEKCAFNPVTNKMEDHTYPQEPKEIDFKKWIFGIQDNIYDQYVERLKSMTPDDLMDFQKSRMRFDKIMQRDDVN